MASSTPAGCSLLRSAAHTWTYNFWHTCVLYMMILTHFIMPRAHFVRHAPTFTCLNLLAVGITSVWFCHAPGHSSGHTHGDVPWQFCVWTHMELHFVYEITYSGPSLHISYGRIMVEFCLKCRYLFCPIYSSTVYVCGSILWNHKPYSAVSTSHIAGLWVEWFILFYFCMGTSEYMNGRRGGKITLGNQISWYLCLCFFFTGLFLPQGATYGAEILQDLVFL